MNDAVTDSGLFTCQSCQILTTATPSSWSFTVSFKEAFKEFKMQQLNWYLWHSGLSTSSEPSLMCLLMEVSCTGLLHYVVLHYLAVASNTCWTWLIFTPSLDPCTLNQTLMSFCIPKFKLKFYDQQSFASR